MTFRQKCVRHIVILGVIFLVIQILLTTNSYDHIVRVYQNSTLRKVYILYGNKQVGNITSTYGNPIQKSIDNRQNNVTAVVGHEGHNGFELAVSAHNICVAQHLYTAGSMKMVHVALSRRLLYCPMEKIGTTFWRRVFYMLVIKDASKFKHPYNVPINTALGQAKRSTLPISSAKSINMLTKSSFSFLFVRNPYSRLLSAFIDKVIPPNPTFWKIFGMRAKTQFRSRTTTRNVLTRVAAVVSGHDVTFAEFVKYVVTTERSNRGIDPHIISINKGCKPCTYTYTYIGRMETFYDDAMFIMNKVGMNGSTEAMKESFDDLWLDDAIIDSIISPFLWKKDVVKYISWEKALQRIWLKLQMRGIIGTNIRLNLSKDQVEKTNANMFIDMARKAHRKSDPVELKLQKDMVKREAFASVPLSDINAFREAYKEDFALFGYDASPAYIFNRTEKPVNPTHLFNYMHLN